jgi:hypothetical protein
MTAAARCPQRRQARAHHDCRRKTILGRLSHDSGVAPRYPVAAQQRQRRLPYAARSGCC